MTNTPDGPHEQATLADDRLSVEVTEDADVATVDQSADEPVDVAVVAPGSFTARHPFLVYSALRFGLLVIAAGVCYLLGARGIVLILGAFIASAIVSFIVLAPQRDAVGQRTGSYFRKLNDRIEASKTAEDDLVDEYYEQSDQPSPDAGATGSTSPTGTPETDKNA